MVFHSTAFWLIIFYYLIINIIMFCTMGFDKKRSMMDKSKEKRRVPEKNLYLLAFLGAGLGGLISMSYFRHKTKHIDFAIVYTIATLMHIIITYFMMGTFVFEFTEMASY